MARSALATAALALACALSGCPRDGGDPAAAGREPAAAFEAALQESDPLVRAHRIAAALQELGPEDVKAATAALDRHAVGVTPEEVRLLMLAWARFDARGAFEWARDYRGGWRRTLMDQAAWAWGYHRGEEALRAIRDEVGPELAVWLRSSVVEGWLRSDDVQRATAYVAALDDPKRRRRLTFTLAGERLRRGVDALVQWAESVPTDSPNHFKQGAFYHASGMVAGRDPRRAAAWFEAHAADWYSEGSLPLIARRWAEGGDAPALFAWLLSLSPAAGRESERDDAIASGLGIWMQVEPDAAAAWLEHALPDARLEPAVVEMTRRLLAKDPAAAVAWTDRIGDAAERERMLVRAARRWLRRDPSAAEAWLDERDLSDEVRRRIERGRAASGADARRTPPGEPR